MVVVTGVGGADVLLRDGSGGVGGRYVYKKISVHNTTTQTLRTTLTLGIRDIDTLDSFVVGEIANRFNSWLSLGGGTFSLFAE